jgi:mannosyltransferase
VVAAVSVMGHSLWVIRYVLFVLMPTALVAAAGLVHVSSGLRPRVAVARLLAVLVVVAGAAVPGQLAVRRADVKNGSNYRTLAAIIGDRQAPGDVVVYSLGRTMRAGVGYYLRADAGAPRDILLRQSAADVGTLVAREYPDAPARLAGAGRIWLVVYGRRADPVTGRQDLTTMLRTRYRRAGLWTVKRAAMALYVRRR